MVVHVGVIVLVVAYVASTSFQTVREVRLTTGQSVRLQGHTLIYEGSTTRTESNKTVVSANIKVDGGKVYAPALNSFPNGSQTIGTPSVRSTLVDDVYLSLLTSPDASGAVNMRIIIEPLGVWMWIGGGIIAVGAALAAFPGRRRNPLDPVSAPSGPPAVAEEPDGPDDPQIQRTPVGVD
jgi:cytochrome c-type biogenesis protein CcmF